ncbi:MAG: prepilin-type N-terminal cleavage/methylation domain-containing protein [bacterium]|nr:prepilin-type N-terminal cleavage/methylation domain-containing protein [Betaproteobacteria bacterium]
MRLRFPPPSSRGYRRLTASGFTAVELVVVIVLLAVLSAVAVPRLAGRSAFETRAFADEVASAVRYAQRTAIAMRRTVTVVVTTPGRTNPCALQLCLTSDCSQQVVNPATGREFCLVPPPAVSLAADGATRSGLQFDARGRPSGVQTYSIASTGAGVETRTLTVEAETGHVR